MKLLVINDPNLNLLGLREPAHYGTENYTQLIEKIQAHCAEKQIEVTCYQSNHEGDLVDRGAAGAEQGGISCAARADCGEKGAV